MSTNGLLVHPFSVAGQSPGRQRYFRRQMRAAFAGNTCDDERLEGPCIFDVLHGRTISSVGVGVVEGEDLSIFPAGNANGLEDDFRIDFVVLRTVAVMNVLGWYALFDDAVVFCFPADEQAAALVGHRRDCVLLYTSSNGFGQVKHDSSRPVQLINSKGDTRMTRRMIRLLVMIWAVSAVPSIALASSGGFFFTDGIALLVALPLRIIGCLG